MDVSRISLSSGSLSSRNRSNINIVTTKSRRGKEKRKEKRRKEEEERRQERKGVRKGLP